ncbi:hypothetical protein ACHAXM_005341 [Skeletonema potamos]
MTINNQLDGDDIIIERLPLARISGSTRAEKNESRGVALLFFRVLLTLILVAALGGTFLIGAYENEDVLEDIDYKGQQETQQQNLPPDVSVSAPAHYNARLSRWKQVGTDCPTGQRLANTSNLHCGILQRNNGQMIEPVVPNQNNGTCGGVTLEPNYCLLPSRGEWTWDEETQSSSNNNNQTTVLLPPLPRSFGGNYNNSSGESLPPPRCKTQDALLNGGTRQGEPFDRFWVPSNNSCSIVPLHPFTWTDDSKCQVTIGMMGDSHIRNLFTAAVHGLRGDYAFAESHAESEEKDDGIILTYEWRKYGDGKSAAALDHFVVHRHTNNNNNKNNMTLFDDCPCNKNITRCLRILFIWSPRFDDQIKMMPLMNDVQTDLTIVAPGNSYEGSTILSQEWTNAMETHLLFQPKDANNSQRRRHLAVLHFPYGRQPKGRSEAIEAWINSISSSNNNETTTQHATNDRISYWQQGQLGFGGKQSLKTWHYACGMGRREVRNDVVMSMEPCTDEADTAYIRAITTIHFDAFGKQQTVH